MSERINVGAIAGGLGIGMAAAGRAFSDSLVRDRAKARVAASLARHRQDVYEDASAAIARRDLRILLGL